MATDHQDSLSRVPRFGIFELSLQSSGSYTNPYTEVEASATLRGPCGGSRSIPLFYDGDTTWRLRFSPDTVGLWHYEIRSSEPGLAGRAGQFECMPSHEHGGIQPMVGFPYHFAYQDGTRLWFMGDTQWRGFATEPEKGMNREAFFHYVDVRSRQSFNYIHVDVMGGAGLLSKEPVFLSFADEVVNPAFFQEVDRRLQYMNARGVTAGLVLAWHRGPVAWDAFPSEAACQRYARYMVARYSAFNVVFIVSGEWDQINPWKKPLFHLIGNEVMACDPHGRMRGIHPCKRWSVAEFATAPWMSFGDYQQLYEASHREDATSANRRALHYALLGSRIYGKPVVNAEYAYYLRQTGPESVNKPHSHTRDSFRRATWVLAMAGGYFVTGFGTTYFGGWRDLGPFDVDAPKNDDAEADIGHLRKLFTSVNWWELEPANYLVNWGGGAGYAYCLAKTGDTYVVYCEGSQRLTLSLDLEDQRAASSCIVQRYDPRSGDYSQVPTEASADGLQLPMPDTQDWAFVVKVR